MTDTKDQMKDQNKAKESSQSGSGFDNVKSRERNQERNRILKFLEEWVRSLDKANNTPEPSRLPKISTKMMLNAVIESIENNDHREED